MRANDRGETLIEAVLVIVLVGMLVPAVYTLMLSIDRGMQASQRKEQVYQIVQRAIETTKAKGDTDITSSMGELPAGYAVSVFDEGNVENVSNLKHYQVVVAYNKQVVFTYDFYWKNS